MALIRNIAGLGAVQDFETLKCADPGCTTDTGAQGGTFLDDNGPYMYQQVPGSGVFVEPEITPVDPITRDSGVDISMTDTITPNVISVGPATSEISQSQPMDTVGLLILGAMGYILTRKQGKGFTNPGLYLGGVAALYYHLKK